MTFDINHNYPAQPKSYSNRIRFLVLHYTGETFEDSLRILTGKDVQHMVSVHYLIGEKPRPDGIIYQLVDEEKRAWHAGDSSWRGHTEVNDSSIGIENVNLDGNKHPFSEEQVQAIIFLCKDIIERRGIEAYNVVGHEDIAPGRKVDPGALFPWERLAKEGIGAWPDAQKVSELSSGEAPDVATLGEKLRAYGYEMPEGNPEDSVMDALNSFRRHFCPQHLEKPIERGSYAVLLALLDKYPASKIDSYMWRPPQAQ